MPIIQAYRCALDPSLAQERMLRSHPGAAKTGKTGTAARQQAAAT